MLTLLYAQPAEFVFNPTTSDSKPDPLVRAGFDNHWQGLVNAVRVISVTRAVQALAPGEAFGNSTLLLRSEYWVPFLWNHSADRGVVRRRSRCPRQACLLTT